MFDIKKARKKGLSEESIKIMEKINVNNQRCESCTGHDFQAKTFEKYVCINCDYEANVSYVKGYADGLKHAGIKKAGETDD